MPASNVVQELGWGKEEFEKNGVNRVVGSECRPAIRLRARGCAGLEQRGEDFGHGKMPDGPAMVTSNDPTCLRRPSVTRILGELRKNPLYWLLAFVPGVILAEKLRPEAHIALFLLSVLAIIPLAALLSHATESVAAKTGDAIGGLLNETLGNLTELVIVITALRAGTRPRT